MTLLKQKKYDIAYLKMAKEWAKLSYCNRRQVGALIVKDKMIISDGYNGTPTGFENNCEDEKTPSGMFCMLKQTPMKVAASTQLRGATFIYTLSPVENVVN